MHRPTDTIWLVWAYLVMGGINSIITYFHTPHGDLGNTIEGQTGLRGLLITGVGIMAIVAAFYTWPKKVPRPFTRTLALVVATGLLLSTIFLLEHPYDLSVIIDDRGQMTGTYADFFVTWGFLSVAVAGGMLWPNRTHGPEELLNVPTVKKLMYPVQ